MEREGKWWGGGQWEGKWHHDDDDEDSDNKKISREGILHKKKMKTWSLTKPAVREGADCPKMEFFIRNRFGSMSAPTPTNIIDQNSVSQS